MNAIKKKHHYVPVSYLKAFCGDDGKLHAYRKEEPKRPFKSAPDGVAFEKYYYAQPTPDGGRDTNRIEDTFSELETKWPPIVNRLVEGDLPNDELEDLFAFIALQRARVPAARDAAEKMLANSVLATTRQMQVDEKLPPLPPGMENLLDHVVVSIDPHQSIHAMVQILQATGTVLDRVGLGVLHNKTDIEFLTSDNPVVYFDPAVPDDELQPYALKNDGHVVLLMPVSPTMLLYGTSWDQPRFASEGLSSADLEDVDMVAHINKLIVRFGYQAVFARNTPDTALIERYADTSPITRADHISVNGRQAVLFSNVFGPREIKPKWEGRQR